MIRMMLDHTLLYHTFVNKGDIHFVEIRQVGLEHNVLPTNSNDASEHKDAISTVTEIEEKLTTDR